jgi:hypothetical protein
MKGTNTDKNNVYELSRFANTDDYRVVGSFPKLLKYFVRNYKFEKIFSFANLKISRGEIYEKNGFILAEILPSDYSYIVEGKLKHRWGYRKDSIREKYPEIYSKERTEYEMMRELGFDRIWDCGKIRYELYPEDKYWG